MSGINIVNRTGVRLAANTTSAIISEGEYDISTTELTVLAVLSEKNKARNINVDTDYNIPANVVITVNVPKGHYIKANKSITFFRVN